MSASVNLAKAYFVEVDQNFQNEIGEQVPVQFNPESLKVSYSNQLDTPRGVGNQTGPASIKYVGAGTTKMTAQLWFDAGTLGQQDVRTSTAQVVAFITPTLVDKSYTPAFVRFQWGTFQFNGVMDSVEETIEYFSPDGRPQRASVNFSLVNQAIEFVPNGQQNDPTAPGNATLTPAYQGGSVQSMASAIGRGDDWQDIAAANGIDNPRMLATGALLDMNADLTGGISVGASTGALGAVAVGGAISVGGSLSVGASVNASGTVGASVGGTVGGGISGSVSASASAAFSVD